jgi:arylsulfatase A-like enzyme
LVAATAAVAAGGGVAAPAENPDPPNIVVVMTDDQTQASLRFMPTVESELAAKGATFANNYTNWPLCCPSRATFYTGQYAHNHGVLGNSAPDGGWAKFDDTSTLPVWLQAAGYRTIHIGKYLNGYGEGTNPPAYVPPGWNEWTAPTAGTTQNVYDYTLNRNGSLVDYGSAATDFKQDVFSDLAVDAIQRNAAGGPFFMGVMYTAPHAGGPNPNPQPPSNCGSSAKPAPRHATAFDSEPLPIPPSYNEADVSDKPAAIQAMPAITDAQAANIQRRYRCRIESLLSVDDGVSRILAALDAAGELDDTLIVFTSDNGFFAGEHRIQSGKNRVYEEAVRVPLVVRGPDVPAGVTVNDLSINADLAPTVLDAAGATPGLVEDGRSLLPFAAHPARFHGRELLLEKGDVGDEEDDQTPQSGTFSAIHTSRYVYVENISGEHELYDLAIDPYELDNQANNPAYDAIEAALASRLATLRSCAGDGCRTKPALEMKLPRHIQIQDGHACRDPRAVRVRLKGAGKRSVTIARFAAGSTPAGSDTSVPLEHRIPTRLLRDHRRATIRASAELIDGRKVSFEKKVRLCR